MQPDVMTAEQVAARWQVHPRTVRDRITRGELRAFRIGDLWRIPADAVADYEAAHAIGAKPTPEPQTKPTPIRVAPAVEEAGYVPVVKGPVPWRSEYVASPATGRARSAGKKKAAVSAN